MSGYRTLRRLRLVRRLLSVHRQEFRRHPARMFRRTQMGRRKADLQLGGGNGVRDNREEEEEEEGEREGEERGTEGGDENDGGNAV